jgi:hypothetical protein
MTQSNNEESRNLFYRKGSFHSLPICLISVFSFPCFTLFFETFCFFPFVVSQSVFEETLQKLPAEDLRVRTMLGFKVVIAGKVST